MTTREDYDLNYGLYLANRHYNEQNYQNKLTNIAEAGSMVLTEADKAKDAQAIRDYIAKVIGSIQKVWDKYKDNVNKSKINYSNEQIQDCIDNNEPNVKVENYVSYNTDFLNSVGMQTLSTIDFQYLTDQKTYLQHYYYNFYPTATANNEKEVNVYKALKDKISTRPEGNGGVYNVTKDDLQKMFDYMKEHKENFSNIQKDLDELNRAVTSAQELVDRMEQGTESNTAPTTQNTTAANNNAGQQQNESYIREADDDNPKPKVVKNDNGTGEPRKKTSLRDQLKLYFSVSSSILSAKMKLSREIFFFYNSVIEQHMINCKVQKGNNGVQQNNANEENNGGENQAPQIKP